MDYSAERSGMHKFDGECVFTDNNAVEIFEYGNTKEVEKEEVAAPLVGVLNGLLISVPIWALIVLMFRYF